MRATDQAHPPAPIRALVVDDEAPARRRLIALLQAHPEVEIVGEAAGADEALVALQKTRPDVVFLDIQMKPKTGFDLLNELPPSSTPVEVVFVTAFDTYALKAFEANAIDYLTKPVRAGRLLQTIQRLTRVMPRKTPPSPAPSEDCSPLVPDDLVILKDSMQTRIVRVGDIRSIQAEGHFTRIGLPHDENFLKHRSFSYWESRLPAELFIRLSRSLLVNKSLITRIATHNRNAAHIFFHTNPTPLAISRLEAERIRRIL